MNATPAVFVRDVPVYGRAILSPMDGFSDLPFRLIWRELGLALSYTGFVSVDELQSHKPTVKAWQKLRFAQSERPMTFQIYGHDEDRLVETAMHLQDLLPTIIDINRAATSRKSQSVGPARGCCASRTRSRELSRASRAA